jgi:hypothetical protein
MATRVQDLYAALLRANGDYTTASIDDFVDCTDAAAKQRQAAEALALAPCESAWDLHLKIRAAHDVIRDESDDHGDHTDGRLQLLACAIERDAIALARRFDEIECRDTRAAA